MKISTSLAAFLIIAAQAAPPPMATGVPAFLDTDGDQKISEAEKQAFDEARAKGRNTESGPSNWDKNGDGKVDDDEKLAAVETLKGRLKVKVASLFLDLAGDDERLTLQEFSTLPQFKNKPPQPAANLFKHLDEDDDGFVTIEEFFKKTGRGNPPPHAQGGP